MLRNFFFVMVTAAWTSVLFPVVCGAMLVTLNAGVSIRIARRWWAPVILWSAGARLVISGRENVDRSRPTIYACNHQSAIDAIVMLVVLDVDARYFAKKILKYVPFFGWYLQLAGHVFVDRVSNRAAVASIRKAARQIRKGTSIVVFPEGTRSETGEILEFKRGAFALAMDAEAATCPVAIEGTGKLLPKNRWAVTPCEVRVKIGAPLPATEFENRNALLAAVRDQIVRLRRELCGDPPAMATAASS